MNAIGPCPHPAFGHLLPEGEGLTRALALSPWERVAEGRVRANSLRRSFLSSSARRAIRPLGMTGEGTFHVAAIQLRTTSYQLPATSYNSHRDSRNTTSRQHER